MKNYIISLLVLVVLTVSVMGAVSYPLPNQLNLMPGEDGRFKIQLQAVNEESDLDCTFVPQLESDLKIKFDEELNVVKKGEVRYVYGTVTAPREYGNFEQKFCAECLPKEKSSGFAVQIKTCDLPIKVNVVDKRNKPNMYVPEKPLSMYFVLGVTFALLAIVILLVYLGKKKRKPVKKTVKKAKKVVKTAKKPKKVKKVNNAKKAKKKR